MIHILLSLLLLITLSGCDGEEQKVPREKPFAVYHENPIVAYCGEDCSRCHQSQEECLRLLQENLPILCDNTKQNCYDLWVHYAARCRRVCSNH
ncbi:MAG: hypothetical protein A2977_01005 [Alphaproteobacteria bacterium RIFCSPLOWO2_01_FULL_45_8]|nr:MAG: hypothetical protein A2065_00445 [Alphaproteobacteria bacterium GWB1_45_5]OFW89955.1 MAG: hypothetical protein A2621_03685 [Alphaproteobacteria bacterium RIFCSPHIGHO2_01_FULL_41_14]OFW96646.1 MAG: hypothetical protein A2977_01005 [Alphaproteobacteria bacterium RIFCSPLOWO2_01_FULL_45_8]HCI48890.1 hypothetical protein [Holosporales bacterium]